MHGLGFVGLVLIIAGVLAMVAGARGRADRLKEALS